MATKITLTQYLGLVTPAWLKGLWGQRWINALGGKQDALVTHAKDGTKSRYPDIAPSGALPYIGDERGIEKAPGESDADYRLRLWGAWETWQWSGTSIGVYNGLVTCGLTVSDWLGTPWWSWLSTWPETGHVWIMNAADWTDCPDGDDDPAHWARFWVVIDGYAEGFSSDGTWGSGGTWGDGGAWGFGSSPTAAEVERWKRVIRKWKGAHATCPAILVITSSGSWGDVWGMPGVWGGSGTWGGSVVHITVGES